MAGDGQSVPRTGYEVPGGIARFGPLRVFLRGFDGRPAPWQPVTFTCRTRYDVSCQLTPGGGDHEVVTVTSNEDGVATLSRMYGGSMNVYSGQLYSGEGAFTVEARWQGVSALFHLSVAPSPPPPPVAGAQLVPIAGDNQSRYFSDYDIRFSPLKVQLRDGAGRPVPRIPVTFTCRALSGNAKCEALPSGLASTVVLTGPDGIATMDSMYGFSVWVLYAPSALEVTASYRDAVYVFHLLSGR